MESNLVIKVKYGDTLRRFNAPIVDGEILDLNMSGLRAKVIGLFNFPIDTQLTLTYVDEDGDIVTLVDDNDLSDVMTQRLKFLRINVQLLNHKLNKPYARSSAASTPLRSPSVNTAADNVLNSVPEPLRDALTKVFSKLSVEVGSKAASASPLLADLVGSFSKTTQSYPSPDSQSGVVLDSSMPVASSESPLVPSAPEVKAADSSSKVNKEANSGKEKGGADVPAITNTAAVGLNSCNPHYVNLTGCGTMPSGPSASNPFVQNDKKNTNENNGSNKGKSVRIDTSTPLIDTRRYSSNECPFSGVPVANDPTVPPVSYHHFSPSKRSFVSGDRNVTYNTFHKGIQCDGCGALPITGPRFKSIVKNNYDLCSICFSKMGVEDEYIKMDRPQHYRHPLCFRASNDHIPRIGPALPHVLRNRVLKLARPKLERLESHFVVDVNVPDGTVMAPSTPFTKIWRMRNSGTMPWYHRMQLVWIGGDKLTEANSVDLQIPVDGVPLDGELDISVDFTAPGLPGRYVSYWMMASKSGRHFGQRVWVLIHVDASLNDSIGDNLQGLNLNLPPESSSCPKDTEIIDMNVDYDAELCNSSAGTAPVEHVDNEQSTKDQTVNDGDFPTSVPTSAFMTCPIIDHGDAVPEAPLTRAYLISDEGVSVPAVQQTPSFLSYPCIDFSEAAPAGPSQLSDPAISEQASPQEESENNVEKILLKELEDMGFKQVDLNKDILRRNEYNMEKSVDDLCGVAEWDPILEELQEMGFCDAETNKKLLKKNNGSIKGVVMDLLTGESAS